MLTYLYGRRKIYIPLFLGMSVNTIVGYALFSWIPTSFARVHGWTMGDIGLGYGLIILATGPLGVCSTSYTARGNTTLNSKWHC